MAVSTIRISNDLPLIDVSATQTVNSVITRPCIFHLAPNVADAPSADTGFVGLSIFWGNNYHFLFASSYSSGNLFYTYRTSSGALKTPWVRLTN